MPSKHRRQVYISLLERGIIMLNQNRNSFSKALVIVYSL